MRAHRGLTALAVLLGSLLVACPPSWEAGLTALSPVADDPRLGTRLGAWLPGVETLVDVLLAEDGVYVALVEGSSSNGRHRLLRMASDGSVEGVPLPRSVQGETFLLFRRLGGPGVVAAWGDTYTGGIGFFDGQDWTEIPLPPTVPAAKLFLLGRGKDAVLGQTGTEAFFWDGAAWRLLRRSPRVELGPWDGQRLRVHYGAHYPSTALYELPGPRFKEDAPINAGLGETELAVGAVNGTPDDFTIGLRVPGLDPSTLRLVHYEAGAFRASLDLPAEFLATTPGSARVLAVEAVPSDAYAYGRVRAVDPKTSAVEVLLEPVGQRLLCGAGETDCVERDLAVFGSLSADGKRFAAVAFDERDGRGRVYARVVSLPFTGTLYGAGQDPVDPPDAGGPGPGPDGGAPNLVTLTGRFEVANGENDRLQAKLEPAVGFGKAKVLQVQPEFHAEVDALRPYNLTLSAEGYQPLSFETFTPLQAGATFDLGFQSLSQGTRLGISQPAAPAFAEAHGTMLTAVGASWILVRAGADGTLTAQSTGLAAATPPVTPRFTPDGVLALLPAQNQLRAVRLSDGEVLGPFFSYVADLDPQPLFAREAKVGIADDGAGGKVAFTWSEAGLVAGCALGTTNRFVGLTPRGTRALLLDGWNKVHVVELATCTSTQVGTFTPSKRGVALSGADDGSFVLVSEGASARCWEDRSGCWLTVIKPGQANTALGEGFFAHAVDSAGTVVAAVKGPQGSAGLGFYQVSDLAVTPLALGADLDVLAGWTVGDHLVLSDATGIEVVDLGAKALDQTLAGYWKVTPRTDGSLRLSPTSCGASCEHVLLDPRVGLEQRLPASMNAQLRTFASGAREALCGTPACNVLSVGKAGVDPSDAVEWRKVVSVSIAGYQFAGGFPSDDLFDAPCVPYTRPDKATANGSYKELAGFCVR